MLNPYHSKRLSVSASSAPRNNDPGMNQRNMGSTFRDRIRSTSISRNNNTQLLNNNNNNINYNNRVAHTVTHSQFIRPVEQPTIRSSFYDTENDSEKSEQEEEAEDYNETPPEERILSELHGEAVEMTTKKRKSKTQSVDELYAADMKKRSRPPRPKITVESLTGPNGLLRIVKEFPIQMKKVKQFPAPKSTVPAAAAAVYVSGLVKLYKEFVQDLLPGANLAEAVYQIHQLGSQKKTKDYLEYLRTQQRNAYLEKRYGKERATKLIEEYDFEKQREIEDKLHRKHLSSEPLDENNPTASQEDDDYNETETDIMDSFRSEIETEIQSISHVPVTDIVSGTATPLLESTMLTMDVANKTPAVTVRKYNNQRDNLQTSRRNRTPVSMDIIPTFRKNSDEDDENEATFDDIDDASKNDNSVNSDVLEVTNEHDVNEPMKESDEHDDNKNEPFHRPLTRIPSKTRRRVIFESDSESDSEEPLSIHDYGRESKLDFSPLTQSPSLLSTLSTKGKSNWMIENGVIEHLSHKDDRVVDFNVPASQHSVDSLDDKSSDSIVSAYRDIDNTQANLSKDSKSIAPQIDPVVTIDEVATLDPSQLTPMSPTQDLTQP